METQLDMPIFWGPPWQIQLAWTLKQTSEEYDKDNFFRAKYVHSQNIDEPVRMERPESPYTNNAYSRQEFYFHRDRLGNITEITDFEGTVVQSYVYDAFGKVTIYDKDGNEITPSSSNYLETPYAFTGRELDPETGLYFYRARYYDSNAGRFISEDPVGFNGGGFNFYKYTENNSLNFIDPTGNLFLPGAIAGAFIGGFGAYLNSNACSDGKQQLRNVLVGAFLGALAAGVPGIGLASLSSSVSITRGIIGVFGGITYSVGLNSLNLTSSGISIGGGEGSGASAGSSAGGGSGGGAGGTVCPRCEDGID